MARSVGSTASSTTSSSAHSTASRDARTSSHARRMSNGSGTAATTTATGVHGGARRGSRMAACLWLPTFELRLELVRFPDLDSTSVALLSPGESTRRTLWQVSERAWEAGARPGQLISQAVSLCPSLTLLDPDPAHYDAAVEAILEALSGRTPIVEPGVERGKVFLGMDGLGRLYGSPKNQLRAMLRTLFDVLPRPLVASYRVGYAPGTFGAWTAAARATPGGPVIVEDDASLAGFLARCPVQALPVEDEMVTRLERLSIRTLGDLVRLPEPALVAQFGQDGRDALAWATARRIDPVRPWHRPRPIRASLEFADATGQLEVWHAALDRLVERALARDARRGRSIHEMRIVGHLEGGGSWSVDAILREPSGEKERLVFVLRSRMGLSPPPRALTGLALELTDFGAPAAQSDLFEANVERGRTLADGKVPPSLKEAVRELRLRLGDSPLYRVVELDPWSRIPERRHALLRFEA